ncbi:MAG: hypoxanthine phosphoribosyltransferase [Acidimicrobiia bacterium]
MSAAPLAPKVLLDEDAIAATVARLASEIERNHPNGVVLVGVLKGALVFLADLARAITAVPVTIDFLALSRYEPDSGRVRLLKDLDVDVTDRDVLIVEDLVDTGLTLAYLVRQIAERGASTVEVCTLLDRSKQRIVPLPLRYVGYEVDDQFVLGYGLQVGERYRNVRVVAAGDRDELLADPDVYCASCYGPNRAV